MKKKYAVLAAGVLAAALALTGCSGEISNDYITISQYKGVEAEAGDTTEVTDEDVDTQIDSTRQMYAELENVDRPAENGDTVTIDYVGTLNGEAFEGGSSEDYQLELGSGTFIDGFEDGIVGHSAGETFDLNLTFPDDYGSTDLAGKDVVFTVTLKTVSISNVPELNDEFVQSVSEDSSTVEEYREEVRQMLEDNYAESAQLTLTENAWSAVMDNTEVKQYPDGAVDEMKNTIREQYQNMADSYGMEFADFLSSYMGMDEDTFEEQLQTAAENQVKQDLIVDLIIDEENLDVSDAALEEIYNQYVEDYGFSSLDDLKSAATEEELEDMARLQIVQEFIVDNCEQVQSSDSE
ncbi:MAG TPA: trigger factor [Candidatus Bariatricus faecipullorum]|nr:trigger factor [Candidatus Bariatricus faecipullorum]